jgi:hypothetical protein
VSIANEIVTVIGIVTVIVVVIEIVIEILTAVTHIAHATVPAHQNRMLTQRIERKPRPIANASIVRAAPWASRLRRQYHRVGRIRRIDTCRQIIVIIGHAARVIVGTGTMAGMLGDPQAEVVALT